MKNRHEEVRYGLLALGLFLAGGGIWKGIDFTVHYREYTENTVSGGRSDWFAIVGLFLFALVGILLIAGNWRKSD